jgi:molecular chaperone DnaJ
VRRVQQSFFGQFVNVSTCPQCGGEGQTLRDPCRTCGGDGRVAETETIAVKVPAGVANGNFIPLRGMGDAGYRGGPAGDLLVIIEERAHPLFVRDGDDLRLDVPASFVTLALGGRVEVPTLAAASASVEVPAGTASGRVFRLRGKGLPDLHGHRGDLLARLVVWIPNRLGANDKKLLEELGRSENFKAPPPSKTLFDRVKDAFAG